MEIVKQFFINLYNNYFEWIIFAIIAIVVIVFTLIVLSVKHKKKVKNKKIIEFEKSINDVTEEEADNIAKAVGVNEGSPIDIELEVAASETTETEDTIKETVVAENEASMENEITNPSTETVSQEKTNNSFESNQTVENSESKKAEQAIIPKKSVFQKIEVPSEDTKETAVETKNINNDTIINEIKPDKAIKSEKSENVLNKKQGNKAIDTETKSQKQFTKNAIPKKNTVKASKENKIIEDDKAVEIPNVDNDTKAKTYSGKWEISQGEDGRYYANLLASNGKKILHTEGYSSSNGAKNGIETVKKNIDGGNFATTFDKYGHYQFRLYSAVNRLICVSEDYSSKNSCDRAIESVKRFAKTAPLIKKSNEEEKSTK